MQGNSNDREIADRGVENTKKKEELERLRSCETKESDEPIPVPPGLIEKPVHRSPSPKR